MSNVNSATPIVSPAPRRTARPLPPAQHPFERITWLFMRYSGLVLIFLALSHFGLQHVFASVHDLTLQSTIARWGTVGQTANLTIWFWRVYYALLLGLAMLHGLNGLRQVAYDYVSNRPLYYLFMSVAALLVLVVSMAGIVALALGVNVAAASIGAPLIR